MAIEARRTRDLAARRLGVVVPPRVRYRGRRLELAAEHVCLGRRQVTVQTAAALEALPLLVLPAAVLGALEVAPGAVDTLGLAHGVVLIEGPGGVLHTLVAGIEVWLLGRMVAARGTRVVLQAVVVEPGSGIDADALALQFLAWTPALAPSASRSQIAAMVRAGFHAGPRSARPTAATMGQVVRVSRQAVYRYEATRRSAAP